MSDMCGMHFYDTCATDPSLAYFFLSNNNVENVCLFTLLSTATL